MGSAAGYELLIRRGESGPSVTLDSGGHLANLGGLHRTLALMAIRVAAFGVLCCLMAPPAAAQVPPGCASVKDNTARLDCQAKRRRSYGEDLERRLAAGGLDVRTFIEETGDPGSAAYPRLIVWTFLTREKVDALNTTEAGILDDARAVGYKMLVYIDKSQQNPNWYFDLKRPGMTPMDVEPPPPPPWMRRTQD
jgi:hypothetical protein